MEAGYFTPAQQDLIQQFVDRRGGGLLLLGGRFALGRRRLGRIDTCGPASGDACPTEKIRFTAIPATVELTPAGRGQHDYAPGRRSGASNVERWKKLPYLMDYQDPGTPKPGAVVLAEMNAGGRKMPLLITENYGRGRTAVLATSGTWRWQMSQPLGDTTHDMFWQQLLRWLVTDTPGHVVASVPSQMLFDDGHVSISADVRDKDYLPAADASVEAHILGPGRHRRAGRHDSGPDTPGTFQAEWTADKPGSYLTEVTAQRGEQELGRDVLTFQRMDGVAENFHTEQNRDLLEKLSSQTGGTLLAPAGPVQAAERNSLFRSRHHRARNKRAVEHADRFFC